MSNFGIIMATRLLIFFAFFCTSCGRHYELTHNNYRVTKNPKFRLKGKFHLDDTSVLSVRGIYQYSCYKDRWFKFYAGGKVLLGYDSYYPTNLNENIVGLAGYYTLENNEIRIELSYAQQRNDWYILELKGKISGDSLVFSKDHPRGINRNIEHFTHGTPGCHYLKVNVPDLLLPADW